MLEQRTKKYEDLSGFKLEKENVNVKISPRLRGLIGLLIIILT